MTGETRRQEIADDLDAAFQSAFGLEHVDTVEDVLAPGVPPKAKYLRDPKLRIAEHFEIEPAFLVLDSLLGTVGIVEAILPGNEPPAETAQQVRKAIDRAIYLRHLLLRDRERKSNRPLTVELVLLTGDQDDAEQRGFDTIGQALRDVLRDTESLSHIGVGVLQHKGAPLGFEGRLRRAFPWLLTATRRWMKSERANAARATVRPLRRLRRLTLTNYRLPGVRDVIMSDSRVHLVHGPNGSGKSSIVEALELVTSGRVERLDHAGEKQYDEVIRNSKSPTPATIEIGWTVDRGRNVVRDTPRAVGMEGLDQPLEPLKGDGRPGVEASSFRLDQPLMDRLIGRFPHERARIFLKAFFPEALDSLDVYEKAAQEHETSLATLQRVVQRLTGAKAALITHQKFEGAASTPTREEFPVLLNNWLEETVLVELLKRERLVRETLTTAESARWKPSEHHQPMVAALGTGQDLEALRRFEEEGTKAIDDLFRQLTSFRPSATAGDKGAAEHPVTQTHVDDLNAVGRFLVDEDVIRSQGPLGHKAAAVINAGEANTYGPIIIGSTGWTAPLVQEIDRLLAACDAVRVEEVLAPAWTGKVPCPEYDAARQFQDRRIKAGRELTVHFADKLRPDKDAAGEFDGSLIAALNELLALFTPARWAYSDILLPPQREQGKLGLPLRLSEAKRALRAELHLNTAELNLFTVALFLLCVGRVAKPMNMLVFDDPLQNMDELTSVALARGLAKVVRLWADLGRSEELLLLFHGYEDVERFSSEVAAATYRLPWLSPSASPATITVKAGSAAGDVLGVQSLAGLSPVLRK